MRLERVFGAINDRLSTYVPRKEIDECLRRAFMQKRQLIIYGASKQGKTTLLNEHIRQEDRITVQCSPTMDLHDVYKTVIKKLDMSIQHSTSSESDDARGAKFSFKVKLPAIAEAGAEFSSSKREKGASAREYEDISSAQDIAEAIKKHHPSKIIMLENFHYLDERQQRMFAFDLRTFQDIDVRVAILGIWREKNRLIQYNGDLQDRVTELPVEPWEERHLMEIMSAGEKCLNISLSGVRDQVISESFGNVGMLQELCKECCYDAGVVETATGDAVEITPENLRNAVLKITNSYASRFYRALETLADSRSRKTADGGHGLGIPYFFVRAVLCIDVCDLKNSVSFNGLRDAMKGIHKNGGNRQFDGSLTAFLGRIGAYQKNRGIAPPIFDYDTNSRQLSIINPDFFFFVKHQDHGEFIRNLKRPRGYEGA